MLHAVTADIRCMRVVTSRVWFPESSQFLISMIYPILRGYSSQHSIKIYNRKAATTLNMSEESDNSRLFLLATKAVFGGLFRGFFMTGA